jgi:hypothetical protein
MPYTPQPGEEGYGLIKAALRDYLIADLSAYGLPSVTELLPSGAAGIIDEGHFTENTPTPVMMFTTLGDGQTADIRANTLVRFIVYAIDRGRGLYTIERLIHRVRLRLNKTDVALAHFAFPVGTADLRIENIEASGSGASATLPAWRAEARGVYVFVTVKGLEADYWS